MGAELNSEIERAAGAPGRRVEEAPAPLAGRAPPRPLAAPPALGEVAWKSAVYGLLLTLLGRPRRMEAAR